MSLNSKYEYPSSGTVNAQMFMCITLDENVIDTKIADALLHIKPGVYSHFIPDSLKRTYPNLVRLASKGRKQYRDPKKTFYLHNHELNITLFAKGPKFEHG